MHTPSKMKSLFRGDKTKDDSFSDTGRFGSETGNHVDSIPSNGDSLQKISKQKAQTHEESPSLVLPSNKGGDDHPKASLLAGIKFPPNIVISAVLLLFIAFGGVAAFFLGQQNQELRQQAAIVDCSRYTKFTCQNASQECKWEPVMSTCVWQWDRSECAAHPGCSFDDCSSNPDDPNCRTKCTGQWDTGRGSCVPKNGTQPPPTDGGTSPAPSSNTSPSPSDGGGGNNNNAPRLSGYVRDCSGNPVANVEVQFHKNTGGNIVGRARSDSNGFYKIAGQDGTNSFALRLGTSGYVGDSSRKPGFIGTGVTKCPVAWESCNPGQPGNGANWYSTSNYVDGFDFKPSKCASLGSPPQCAISGPTKVTVGKSASYQVSMTDSDGDFNYSQLFSGKTNMDPKNQVWTQIGGNISYSPQSVSRSWTCQEPGQYYVLCNGRDNSDYKCSGNPWCDGTIASCVNWFDCGPNDRITVTCEAAAPANPQCNESCQTTSDCKATNANWICSNSKCRHKDYPSQPNCQPLSAPSITQTTRCESNNTPSVTVSWQLSSSYNLTDVAYFKIFRCGVTDSSKCTPTWERAQVNKNGSTYSFKDTQVFANGVITHYYRVRAFNKDGVAISGYSNVVSATKPLKCGVAEASPSISPSPSIPPRVSPSPSASPSPSPSSTPPSGKMCTSISFYPNATYKPQPGDSVRFQCNPTGLASQGYSYLFRIKAPNGSTTDLTAGNTENPSKSYTLSRNGEYTAECAVCPASDNYCSWSSSGQFACSKDGGNTLDCLGACPTYCDTTTGQWRCTNCEAR